MTTSPDLMECWVLLWSEEQQAFHVQTVQEMIHHNWDSYFHRGNAGNSDWILVGLQYTPEELEHTRRWLEAELDRPSPE